MVNRVNAYVIILRQKQLTALYAANMLEKCYGSGVRVIVYGFMHLIRLNLKLRS